MELAGLFSLQGRVALITGGSRGLGRMIAQGFIAAGGKVYISSRKAEQCEATAKALGPNCIALPADVSSPEGMAELIASFSAQEAKLDILVNNAGVAWGASFEEADPKSWDKVFGMNVKSPFFLTQGLHGALKAGAASGQMAKVINIGSIDGLRLSPWETYSYQASKAALHHLTRRMASRLIADGIVVNAIAPGAFPSDMNRAARDRPEEFNKDIPSGRVGTPEDIAGAAVYLASRAGDYVVGTTLAVDGGLVNAYAQPLAEA